MSESYCLKSCAECGQCGGCRSGSYAARCDIAKCCREKNHESCESCTRTASCPTRWGRDQMPRKLELQDRRRAEALERNRAHAAVLARWTNLIFWCLIAMNVVSLLEFFEDRVPALRWIGLGLSAVQILFVAYCYLQMREVDATFGTVAVLRVVAQGISTLVSVFLTRESALQTVILVAAAVVALIEVKLQTETFRDVLSGISMELSDKWERQWGLYKIALYILLGGLVSCLILSVWGLAVVVAGLGVLLFVYIREYVYLYQTARGCADFSQQQAS